MDIYWIFDKKHGLCTITHTLQVKRNANTNFMYTRNRLRPGFSRLVLLFILFVAGLSVACQTRYVITDMGVQAYYQTNHPLQDTSRDIAKIFESVKRVNVVGYYSTFLFSEDAGVTEKDVNRAETYNKAVSQFAYTQSKAGTATVIARSDNNLILITNDHVVSFPDTLVFFYDQDEQQTGRRGRASEKIVERISIRVSQINMIFDMPRFGPFQIVSRDKNNDIALIAVKIPDEESLQRTSILSVGIGDPEKLNWGSFVYVFGYPKGYKMVSRAIVSDPNRDRLSGFLIDGQFNEGISGGLILAIRAETGEMEWVGMARAASASSKVVLVPVEKNVEDYAFHQSYTGEVFLDVITQIEYGITIPVSMKAIQNFFRREDRRLRDEGYYLGRAIAR
ncbi:MAG: serine protease [Balneolaceae bacterium]|nr:MAG: serine protease [Balneolaceae bacterium]